MKNKNKCKKIYKKLSSILLSLLLSLILPTVGFGFTDTYHVHTGDSLWIISKKYKVDLGTVVKANPQFSNPNLIYPGDRVYIPLEDSGKAMIGASVRDSGDGGVKITRQVKKTNTVSLSKGHWFEGEVARLVNVEREARGLPPLTLSPDISNIARIKAEDMRDKKYFDHNSPTYGSPFEMMNQFGLYYKIAGENIAKGQNSPADVVRGWMDSEGHRNNILHSRYKEIGVGFATDSMGKTYWVQQFVVR